MLDSALEDFNCRQENLRAQALVFGPAGGAVAEKLAITPAAERPVLALVEREALPMLVEQKAIFPVESLIESSRNLKRENWVSSAEGIVRYGNHLYGMPATLNPYVLIYNPSLLSKIGSKLPSQWDDMFRLQKELDALNKSSKSEYWTLNTRSIDSLFSILCAQNDIAAPEAQQKELLGILQFLKQAREQKLLPPYYKYWDPNFLEVTGGKVLFQIEDAASLASMKDSTQAKIDVGPMPLNNGNAGGVLSDSPIFVLCQADRQEQARDFLEFFYTSPQYEKLQEKFFFVSPLKNERLNPQDEAKDERLYEKVLDAVRKSSALPLSDFGGTAYSKAARVVARLDAALITPEQALQEIIQITAGEQSYKTEPARPISVSWADSACRIFSNQSVASLRSLPVSVTCAGNEYESFQLAFAGLEQLRNVTWRFEPFMDCAGSSHVLPVAVYRQIDTRIRIPLVSERPGNYPNILKPAQSIDLAPDEMTRLWVTIYVPKNVPAGAYKSTMLMTGGDKSEIEVPVTLNVLPFSLPSSPSQPAVIGLNYDLIARHYKVEPGSAEYKKLMDSFYWFMVEHRLSPYQPPVSLVSPDLGTYVSDDRVSACRIPFPPTDESYDSVVDLAEKGGWLDKLFVYFIDEPTYHQFSAVVETGEKIHSVEPHPKFLVTCFPEKSLIGSVDIWCIYLAFVPVGIPHMFLDRREYLEKVERRRAAGEAVWWYTAGPIRPFPTLHIEDDPAAFRVIPWLQQLYNLDGFLHWEAANWIQPADEAFIPHFGNGEGVLVYPGNMAPASSIRLELLREGLEDMEYLLLLKRRIEEVQKNLNGQELGDVGSTRIREICRRLIQPEALLADASAILPLTSFCRAPGAIEEARSETATEIMNVMERPYVLLLTDTEEKGYTEADSARFYGITERQCSIEIDGKRFHPDANGAFSIQVPLTVGRNIFVIQFTDGRFCKKMTRTIEKQ